MAISDKLNYLIETKQLFKDRLNSLGAEITSSTTFRNYLTWLDTFYGEVSDKTDLSVNGVVGRTSQNTAILPSEYTQVDYIESHGTEYIDTGVNADNNLRVVLDFAYTSISANQNIGAIRLASENNARYHILSQSGFFKVYVNDAGYITISIDTNRHLFDIKPALGIATIDNQDFTIPSGIRDVNLNFWLFGRNSTSAIYMSKVKQWACKMYYNNELVRDFIPCYRNSDNEIGLYDIVNNVFYTNQGTGAFTYGSVVSIPNPDYPQPINNLSGDVAYKVSGKNKLNTSTIEIGTKSGVTCSYNNETQEITFNGTCTYDNTQIVISTNAIDFTNGVTKMIAYYVSGSVDVSSTTDNRLLFRTFRGNGQWDLYAGINIATLNSSNPIVSITGGSTGTKLRTDFRIDKNTVLTNFKIKLMITDSEDTTYEPYIEPQTFNIPLGDIELCKIDTYEDKIYKSNNKWYLEKNVGKAILNGSSSETWGFGKAGGYYRLTLNSIVDGYTYNDSTRHIGMFISSHFKSNTSNGIGNCFQYKNTYLFYPLLDITTKAQWITWLNNNNMTLYYVLATPTTTEITQENYPALYNALKQIQDYLTAYKINKEFILGYSSPEIEY